jgi:GR25 family glycosyltransferase involved in LPS biosynthesis
MKLSDFHIVYINLDKRPEKRQFIERQLHQLGLLEQAQRFPGIDGQTIKPSIQEHYLKRFKTMAKKRDRILGRIGCYLSHKCVLHSAMISGVDNLLILEDDCQFLDLDPDMDIPPPPKDTDIFYLGGLFWNQEPEPKAVQKHNNRLDWIRLDRKYVKLACALSYGIIGRDKIREVYETIHQARPSAIDLLYINFIQQKKDKPKGEPGDCYILNPVACIQVADFESDVTFKGGKNPDKPYKNSYFYTKKQEEFFKT